TSETMKSSASLWVFWALASLQARSQDVQPFPRTVIKTEVLVTWNFREGVAGWRATHDCTLMPKKGGLQILSLGNDPYLASPPVKVEGPLLVNLRARCATSGPGQIFWITTAAPSTQEARCARFPLIHDGQWHDYSVSLPAKGTVTWLRFDPGDGPGTV